MAYTELTDINKILENYVDDVESSIEEITNDIAEDGVKQLKNTTQPDASELGTSKQSKRRKWNKYSKSWKIKKDQSDGYVSFTIHNNKYYRLTHLLEKGHATVDGKRTRAFKHIEPVEKYCVNRVEKEVEEIIKKGGK